MDGSKCNKWLDLLLKKGYEYDKAQAVVDRLLRIWNSQEKEKESQLVVNFLTQTLARPGPEMRQNCKYLNAKSSALILAMQRDLLAFVSQNPSTWMSGHRKMSSSYWTLARDSIACGVSSSVSLQLDPFSLNK